VEIARKRILKERPHNSHPCEFARNGFIQEIKKWNPQETAFASKGMELARNGGGICKECILQGMQTTFVYHSSVDSSIWPAIGLPVYVM